MQAEQISKLFLTALLEIDFNAKQYDCRQYDGLLPFNK